MTQAHVGLVLQRIRLCLRDEAEPYLELGINLRSAEDIFMQPEVRLPAWIYTRH